MTDTINGKTPEEVKRGIRCDIPCGSCAYYKQMISAVGCSSAVEKDVIDLIQHLEERNSALYYTLMGVMHSIDKWLDVEPYDFDSDDGTVAATRAADAREVALKEIEELRSRLAQAERERDAAVTDIRNAKWMLCHVCKNYYRPDPAIRHYACKAFGEFSKFLNPSDSSEDGYDFPSLCGKFKWRGVCAENTKEENKS